MDHGSAGLRLHLLGLIIFGHEVSEMVSVVPRCHQQSHYDSGLELSIASTSVTEVERSSYVILVFPIVFFKHPLVALNYSFEDSSPSRGFG